MRWETCTLTESLVTGSFRPPAALGDGWGGACTVIVRDRGVHACRHALWETSGSSLQPLQGPGQSIFQNGVRSPVV